MIFSFARLAVCLLLIGVAAPVLAQTPFPPADPAVVGVDAATDAYLATVPAEARARSDSYFEGGYFAVIIAVGFAITGWAFAQLAARYRTRWRVEGIADPAGLPLIALIFGAYLFLLTPLVNTIIRTNEYEADIFGLNAARQPDGFAVLLGDYRKLDPSALEEAIFFDHPSGRTRIRAAMQWKANQQR